MSIFIDNDIESIDFIDAMKDGDVHNSVWAVEAIDMRVDYGNTVACLLYTSPSPRDKRQSRMPSSA